MKTLKVKEISNGTYHMCWAEGLLGGAMNGTKAQCERAFAGSTR